MAEQSSVQIGGHLHISIPKATRHDRCWIAAQREAGRLKRIADAIWKANERNRPAPKVPEGEGV
jgi:hypothetical protein